MIQGIPSPRNTFTEFDPVMFPIAASAWSDCSAAAFEAKVSGREVPRATNEMAVTDCLRPITQPNKLAISPTTAVIMPMKDRATMKANHPLTYLAGGIIANSTFHPIDIK